MLDQKVSASISDLLDGTVKIDQLVHETPSGLKLIPGGSGVLELMNIDSKKRWEVIKSLDYLENETTFSSWILLQEPQIQVLSLQRHAIKL